MHVNFVKKNLLCSISLRLNDCGFSYEYPDLFPPQIGAYICPGVLPYKRLMGMCRWMRSHFHYWIDYDGVAFSTELLERGHTSSDFGG